MNILVSGGAGYIGSQVSYDLISNGHNVTIVDNLSTGNKNLIPKNADFYKCDISDIKKLKLLFKIKKIDLVIHLAAYISVEESIKNPRDRCENHIDRGTENSELEPLFIFSLRNESCCFFCMSIPRV